MNRRAFIVSAAAGACSHTRPRQDCERDAAAYLSTEAGEHPGDLGAAALAWFRACKLGLHLEYGVHSQLGRGAKVQFDERIPPGDYERLKQGFAPGGFDASKIAELARTLGFRYVGLDARHADGFCLFRTTATDFNALEVTGRDLLAELRDACAERALGLMVSFSYAADWRHPYFYPAGSAQTGWQGARPAYETPPKEYKFRQDEDFLAYIRDAHHQLEEIAYRYQPLAGIRFQPEAGYHARPDLFPVSQAYSLVRQASQQTLISFGAGASGEEDFCSVASPDPLLAPTALAAAAWERNRTKPREVEFRLGEAGGPGERFQMDARRDGDPWPVRLLARIALRADGSIAPQDEGALSEFARQIAEL